MMPGNPLQCRGTRSTFHIILVGCSFLVLFSLLLAPKELSEFLSPSSLSENKKYFESVLRDRKSRGLPDFSNGGIIVFYHVYKTGGSTVGKLLHEIAREDQAKHPLPDGKPIVSFEDATKSDSRLFFTMIRKRVDWKKDCVRTLDLAEQQKKLILLELHVEYPTTDFPTLVELAPMLDTWREEADRRGVGFFAFTLLREPVAHALSFFNFFHVGTNKDQVPTLEEHDFWNPFKPLVSTEANFLHSYFANNRQCRMLSSDAQSIKGAPLDIVWDQTQHSKADLDDLNSPCRVDKVYDAYFNSLDWVGTTEKLQNETLPLLTKLVANDPKIGRFNAPFKVFDKNPNGYVGMKKYDLSKKSMTAILKKTQLDRALYADVTRSFRLEDFGWDYQSPLDG